MSLRLPFLLSLLAEINLAECAEVSKKGEYPTGAAQRAMALLIVTAQAERISRTVYGGSERPGSATT